LPETSEVTPSLIQVLGGYNLQGNTSQMNIIFFSDCISHLARIARILRQQRGNAFLVGVGGSGRSSMAKLAAYMNKMSTFSIEIAKGYKQREFHEDIKEMLKRCVFEENE
jgi:dynein heavy chain